MPDPSPLVRHKADPFRVLGIRIEEQKAEKYSDDQHCEA